MNTNNNIIKTTARNHSVCNEYFVFHITVLKLTNGDSFVLSRSDWERMNKKDLDYGILMETEEDFLDNLPDEFFNTILEIKNI